MALVQGSGENERQKEMKIRLMAATALCLLALSCKSKKNDGFIGSGVVDADVIKLAATTQGQLVSMRLREGDHVKIGDTIAVLDSVPLVLKRSELDAADLLLKKTIAAKILDIETLKIQSGGTSRESDRMKALADANGASKANYDQVSTAASAQDNMIKAASAAVDAQRAQSAGIAAQRAELADQIKRCIVISPASGTVTQRWHLAGEMVSPASPIAELAMLDTVRVDFFVPQPNLADVKIGSTVQIRTGESDKTARFTNAIITWVSDEVPSRTP